MSNTAETQNNTSPVPALERPDSPEGLHQDFVEMDAIEDASNVTSITDAPSLRRDATEDVQPSEFKDYQRGFSDPDPNSAQGLELPRTDTIREEDVIMGGARRMKQHSGGKGATRPRIRGAFIDKNLSARKAAVVERTKELNGLNIGSIEPGVIAKPVEQEPISRHPREHPTDFEKRKQEAFLNDPRVQEADAYINGEDLITKGEQVS